MDVVKSKYKLSHLLVALFFALIGFVSWFFFFNSVDDKKFHNLTLFVGIVFSLFFISIVYYLINVPLIIIQDSEIILKWIFKRKRNFKWTAIEKIDLISMTSFNGEGATIYLYDNSFYFIKTDDYGNMPLLRRTLQSYIKHYHKEPFDYNAQSNANGKGLSLRDYKGNPWFTPYMIGFYTGILLLLTIGVANIFGITVVAFASFIFIGWRMFYFQLSNDRLVVKNHLWFWYKKEDEKNYIDSIIYERSKSGTSSALRVILKNFESKGWQAGSLREKDWQGLRDHIDNLSMKFLGKEFIF